MGEEETLDFSRVCRVCRTEGPALPLFRVNLHRKVMACAAVQVWQNDGLPGQICKRCAARLHISFQFKRQCEKSDLLLRRYRDSGKYVESAKSDVSVPENEDRPASAISLPTSDCNFAGCSIRSLTDNREYESIHNIISVDDQHSPMYANGDILVSVEGVDLPMRDQFDLTNGYSGQTLANLALDNAFTDQVMGQTHGVGDQILALEALTVPDVISIQKPDEQSFDVGSIDANAASEENEDGLRLESEKRKNEKTKNESEILHCPICNKAFDTTGKLNRHARTHSDEILYRCDVCNKGFIHGGNFKVHLRIHNDERPFSCNVCHKKCRQQQDLDKHMRTHTGERPHICSICRKAFTTSSNLAAHVRIHRGEKPYICTVCQKAFCQSNELTKHVRTHTGEKSHTCPICKKGFNGSSTLVVHMRIHTGERPYVCTICNKGFTQSSCLAVHTKKHLGKNEFSCGKCPRTFGTVTEFQNHNSTDHPVDLACSEPGCVRLFSRPNDLLRHVKLYHSKRRDAKLSSTVHD